MLYLSEPVYNVRTRILLICSFWIANIMVCNAYVDQSDLCI